jgi:hypothetical protein
MVMTFLGARSIRFLNQPAITKSASSIVRRILDAAIQPMLELKAGQSSV